MCHTWNKRESKGFRKIFLMQVVVSSTCHGSWNFPLPFLAISDSPVQDPWYLRVQILFCEVFQRRLGFQLSFTSENFLISNHCTFTRPPASCVGICCYAWDVVTQLRPRLKSKICHSCYHGCFQKWNPAHQLPHHCRKLRHLPCVHHVREDSYYFITSRTSSNGLAFLWCFIQEILMATNSVIQPLRHRCRQHWAQPTHCWRPSYLIC